MRTTLCGNWDTAASSAKIHNPMDPYNRFHLAYYKPYGSARAKALCGATLRKNMPYALVESYLEHIREGGRRRWVYSKNSNNTHTLVMMDNYQDRVCPECEAHPDIALTLLAAVP